MPEETPEDIVKVHIFAKESEQAQAQTGSKQLEEVSWKEIANTVVEPPYNPTVWAALLEKNTRLNSLGDCMALNTVGLGWSILPSIDPDDITPEVEAEIKRQASLVKPLFDRPNQEMSFLQLMKRVKKDEESVGNGYIEVSRSFLKIKALIGLLLEMSITTFIY